MEYILEIDGLPPKKDGANSMWNKDKGEINEVNKLIKLRNEALSKLKGKVIESNLKLTLKVYLKKNNKTKGDLDNFLTGICDGLMVAHKGAKISPKFKGLDKINPEEVRFIVDDFKIIEIIAKKIVKENIESERYKLILTEV